MIIELNKRENITYKAFHVLWIFLTICIDTPSTVNTEILYR